VFQEADVQLFCSSVFDELAFGPLQLELAEADVRARVAEAADALRIGKLLDRAPYALSGGEKKRVAIAAVLAMRPDVLLMDEPTNALDPLTQKLLYDILSERREEGATILFSSHNLPEVERIANRVGIVRKGTLVGTERIEDLRGMRLRNVEVFFDGDVPGELDIEKLEGVSGIERVGNRLTLKLKGDINPLIKMIARYDVADFSVSHASLEDVFLEFYKLEPPGEPGLEQRTGPTPPPPFFGRRGKR